MWEKNRVRGFAIYVLFLRYLILKQILPRFFMIKDVIEYVLYDKKEISEFLITTTVPLSHFEKTLITDIGAIRSSHWAIF